MSDSSRTSTAMVLPSSRPVADSTPCAVETKLWRECLKEYDYSPDKPKGACETQRLQYYSCIKDWKKKTYEEDYDYRQYHLIPECGKEAEKLHQCMMIGMFEIRNCKEPMLELKRCGMRHDPTIRSALSDDPELKAYMAAKAEENPTGLKWLWYKAIGKA